MILKRVLAYIDKDEVEQLMVMALLEEGRIMEDIYEICRKIFDEEQLNWREFLPMVDCGGVDTRQVFDGFDGVQQDLGGGGDARQVPEGWGTTRPRRWCGRLPIA